MHPPGVQLPSFANASEGDLHPHPLGGWPRGTIRCKIQTSLTRGTHGGIIILKKILFLFDTL
jgi:hypothetical protein